MTTFTPSSGNIAAASFTMPLMTIPDDCPAASFVLLIRSNNTNEINNRIIDSDPVRLNKSVKVIRKNLSLKSVLNKAIKRMLCKDKLSIHIRCQSVFTFKI